VTESKLPKGYSAFLWGPRKTGKTTFLRAAFPDSLSYDLLKTDLFLELVKRPFLLREQLLAAPPKQLREPVIIDEVQKVPQLLDEIHWLIENRGLRFILCGSSARKLKRGKANLLGGRAWRYEMRPLIAAAVADLDLLRALNRGMIPLHYMVDTLLGTMLEPYERRKDRNVIIKAGKFYLFDVGVAGAITHRRIPREKGEQFGRALEHFILMELLAHRAYRELNYNVNFWQKKSGLEVDFILGCGEVAIEVKGTSRVDSADLRPLMAFIQEYRPARAFVVCNERAPRVHEDIRILPWHDFLKLLWNGEVIS
jgi:predicted AAA+ superfamily ATPase